MSCQRGLNHRVCPLSGGAPQEGKGGGPTPSPKKFQCQFCGSNNFFEKVEANFWEILIVPPRQIQNRGAPLPLLPPAMFTYYDCYGWVISL